MHTGMFGFYGDRILVNGRPDYNIDVASRAYRLRILNGSNARIYKLAWDDGSPITVIGVDGGLLERPETKPYVMLAPAERLDIWADFSGRAVGAQFVMRTRFFWRLAKNGRADDAIDFAGRRGLPCFHGARHSFDQRNSHSAAEAAARTNGSAPKTSLMLTTPCQLRSPRRRCQCCLMVALTRWTMCSRAKEFQESTPTQLIEIFHDHGGGEHGRMGMMGGMGGMMGRDGMMSMAHPIHLHGQPFQIVERFLAAMTTPDTPPCEMASSIPAGRIRCL